MNIKYAEIKDFEEITKIVNKLADETRLPRPVWSVFSKFWEKQLTNKTGLMLMALKNDKTIGILGAITAPEPNTGMQIGVVSHWYVDPEYRKLGVGKALLSRFEEWAINNGCKMLSFSYHITKQKMTYSNGYRSKELMYIKEI